MKENRPVEFNEAVDEKTLLEFVRTMTGGSQALAAKVKSYLDRPMEYAQSPYAELSSFEESDIEESLGDPDFRRRTFPSDIVLCVLMRERFVTRVDHRSSPDNIQSVVDRGLAQKGLAPMQWTWTKEQKKGVPSWDLLNATVRDLEPHGVQLAWIYDGSDSFLTFVAAKEDFQEILRLSSRLGLSIRTKFE